MADVYGSSWTYYQFKSFGDYSHQYGETATMGMYNEKGVLDFSKYEVLTRAYAPYIQGSVMHKYFDTENAIFILQYMVDTSINAATEIYLNSKEHFRGGYKFSLNLGEDDHKFRTQINEADPNYLKIKI